MAELEVALGAAAAGHLEDGGDGRVPGGDDRVLAGGQVDEAEGAVGAGGEGVDDVARRVEEGDPGVLDRAPSPARTVPRSTAPPASSMSWRVSREDWTLTGSAAGRKAGALAASVYSPATSSPMTYPPSRPLRVEATTSPRTSVRVTAASRTGVPSAVTTLPASRPAPPRTTSSSTGRSPTVTETACGWCPPAAAIRTYAPPPGTLRAYRPSSPLAPRPICRPWTSMRVSAARGTRLPSWCWTVPQTGTPECGGAATGAGAAAAWRACGTAWTPPDSSVCVASVRGLWWDTSGFSLRKKARTRPSTRTGTR